MQRVPPTEKKGRVHTSTVTVAVLDEGVPSQVEIHERDLRVEWFSGTGAGGQHRNKHANSCRLIHIPTGLKREAQCRSRKNRYEQAKAALTTSLIELHQNAIKSKQNHIRKEHVGGGARGEKIRTYRFQEDRVIDHVSGKTATCSKVMKGLFADLS